MASEEDAAAEVLNAIVRVAKEAADPNNSSAMKGTLGGAARDLAEAWAWLVSPSHDH